MKNFFIRKFGLKGSWQWAFNQMEKGEILERPTSNKARVKLKLNFKDQICWYFGRDAKKEDEWAIATVYVQDFRATDWKVFKENKEGLCFK